MGNVMLAMWIGQVFYNDTFDMEYEKVQPPVFSSEDTCHGQLEN